MVIKSAKLFFKKNIRIMYYTIYSNSSLFLGSILLIIGVYLAYVRHYRYAYLNQLIKKYPNPDIVLQDHDIALEIYSAVHSKEFVFSTRMALFMTVVRPLAITSISKLMSATRKSTDYTGHRVRKTTIDICEFLEPQARIQRKIDHGYTVDKLEEEKQFKRREKAFERINKIHLKYKTTNEEYLHVLYISALEVVRWVDLCEWRKLDIREMNAIFKVWYEVGVSLNIKNIPPTIQEWTYQMHEFGKKNGNYHSRNWDRVIQPIDYIISGLPRPLRRIVYSLLPCVLEDYECSSFGISTAAIWKRTLLNIALNLRGWFVRYLCLPRSVYETYTPYEYDLGELSSLENPFQYRNNKKAQSNQKSEVAEFVPMCPHLQSLPTT